MNKLVLLTEGLLNKFGRTWKTRLHHDLTFKEGKFILGFTFYRSNEIFGVYVENKEWDDYIHIPTILKAQKGVKFITNVWSNQ